MKECKKCNIEKPLSDFCNRKGEIDGKHRYCKSCLCNENKTYYESGRKNSDYYKKYRIKNKEYFNTYSYNHYHTNKELYREWNRNKYYSDRCFRIKHSTSARINQALKTYNTLKRNRTIEYLGCSMEEYTQYLENQFDNKMNWDNYGTYWEIDHIMPVDSFDLDIEDNLYKCFHFKNTQPLEKTENRKKSNNITR
jgi:hypothetical protein